MRKNFTFHPFIQSTFNNINASPPLRGLGLLCLKMIWSCTNPDSKVHGTNMGPTWVLLASGGPHVGPINLAIRGNIVCSVPSVCYLSIIRSGMYFHTLGEFYISYPMKHTFHDWMQQSLSNICLC